jgi:hypothetical protein
MTTMNMMMTTNTKNSQKKGQKPGNLADGGDPGGQLVTEKPVFLTFLSFFHDVEHYRKIFNINDEEEKIFKEYFNYLHGEGFPISSRSKYEGKWGKMGFLTKTQKILFQAAQVT